MYSVGVSKQAERGLRLIRRGDPVTYRRLVAAIRDLAEEPRPPGCVKLTGFDPPAWRIRVGGYRVVYDVDDERVTVVVINLAPRGEVYC